MKQFKSGKYSEFKTKSKEVTKSIKELTEYPHISTLPDGDYIGKRYGYTFELDNGECYKTTYGVRCSKAYAPSRKFRITKGNIEDINGKKFSGFGEIGGVMQGMSYGPKDPNINDTRISIDTSGFRIPKETLNVFKLNNKQKRFSNMINPRKNGVFTGEMGKPSITISKDNTILRSKDSSNGTSQAGSTQNPSMTKLDWNSERAFHLAVEPWVTSPLMSDTGDGIYIGSIKNQKIDTGKTVINLMISVPVDYPESVVVLVKNRKAFIFKQSQLTATTGSRIFSGKCPDSGCVQQKDNGSWGIISNTTGEFWKPDYKSKESAENALKAYHANKSFSELPGGTNYIFNINPIEPKFEMQVLVGTLIMSVAFGHLFHLCTDDYPVHIALNDYYHKMPDIADDLAEAYLEQTKAANFQVCIVPTSMCPVAYFEKLLEYVSKYQDTQLKNEPSYSSLVDEAIKLIKSTLYKIKRLSNKKKVFSINGTNIYSKSRPKDAVDWTKELTKEATDTLRDSLADLIIIYYKKFKKSPVKEVDASDGKKVREYAHSDKLSDSDVVNILNSIIRGLTRSYKIIKGL